MSLTEILVMGAQFFLSLSILIVLHELGHFIPAKLFKTKVEKFYLFFDVKFSLVKKKIGETVYGIGWLPLGGYVKIAGMIDESMDTKQLEKDPEPWEFRSKPAWQRLIIMLGGVSVNFVLAWVIYIGMSFFWGEKYLPKEEIGDLLQVSDFVTQKTGLQTGDEIISIDGKSFDNFQQMREGILLGKEVEILRNGETITLQIPKDFIGDLVDDKQLPFTYQSPLVVAEIAGDSPNIGQLKKEDIILAVNGTPTKYFNDTKKALDANKGKQIIATVYRNKKRLQIPLQVNQKGMLGVSAAHLDFKDVERLGYFKLSTKQYSLAESFSAGTRVFKDRFASFGKQLKALVTPSTGAYKSLGSFISIAKIFDTNWNWERFWSITAFLSIMLGVLNLLPIPALDGGHAMFLVYELVAGRKPSDKFLGYAQTLGIVLLISLFVFAFGNDIYRNFVR